MKKDKHNKEQYLLAKEKLRKLKVFYIHLVGYLVMVALLVYNLVIIEANQYSNTIIWLNCTTIVVWGLFLVLHAWTTFKGRIWFKKDWEDKKIEEYMNKENTFWE